MNAQAASQNPAASPGCAVSEPPLPGPGWGRVMPRNASVVTVSDVHLKEGAPGSESWCALAVSLREELHASTVFDEIEVTAAYVRVSLRHGAWWAETTRELREFITEFDATEDEEGTQVPARLEALQAKASAGRLSFPLTWHEGDPPPDSDES